MMQLTLLNLRQILCLAPAGKIHLSALIYHKPNMVSQLQQIWVLRSRLKNCQMTECMLQ